MEAENFVIKAPGKLSLLGEYAVLEKSIPAVGIAINKGIYCYIRESKKIIFSSRRINLSKIEFEYKDQKMNLISKIDEIDVLSFSKNAMEITLRYLEEIGITIKQFEINILSDLSNRYNVKFGFGSSAAVTVAIVGGLLYLHGFKINQDNKDVIFKLSAISHFISQGSGSGIDIAASTYGGLFVYKSYTSDWMREKTQNIVSVKNLVNEKWEFFEIDQITVLMDIFFSIGWTGKASSTKYFLAEVNKIKNSEKPDDLKFYNDFLLATKKVVEIFIQGVKNGKREQINRAIAINRNLLKELANRSNVEMETQGLKYLVGVAKKLGLEAKFSGAGGGDCGYAVLFNKDIEPKLKDLWTKYGIEPLDLKINDLGVCEISFITDKKEKSDDTSNDTVKRSLDKK